MFSRTIRSLRPLKTPSAPLIQAPIRFVLPIRTQTYATGTVETAETNPPTSSPSAESSSESSSSSALSSSSTETAATTINTTSTFTEPIPSSRQLPYFVDRNPFNNFGVYQQRRRGGNLKVTLLKKGVGNLMALKYDIADALKLSKDDVSVNNVTRHVMIRVSLTIPL